MLEIRRAIDNDFDGIWPIFQDIVRQGETYAFSPDTDKAEAYRIWMLSPQQRMLPSETVKSLEPISSSRTSQVLVLTFAVLATW